MSTQYQLLPSAKQQHNTETSLPQEKIAPEKKVIRSQTPDVVKSASETLERDASKTNSENILPAPMPGYELIDRIDSLGFTQQDQDEMTRAVREGRTITYEDWSRKLFD